MMGGANTPYGAPYPEPPPGACFSAASMPPQMMDPMNQQFQQTILVPEDGYTQDPRMFAHSPVDASGMPYPQGILPMSFLILFYILNKKKYMYYFS